MTRWNKVISGAGIDFEIRLPHVAFNRSIGEFLEIVVSPVGEVLTQDGWTAQRDSWLPTPDDRSFIEGLMKPEFRRGHFAGWIAPPTRGIQNKPDDFLYVKLP